MEFLSSSPVPVATLEFQIYHRWWLWSTAHKKGEGIESNLILTGVLTLPHSMQNVKKVSICFKVSKRLLISCVRIISLSPFHPSEIYVLFKLTIHITIGLYNLNTIFLDYIKIVWFMNPVTCNMSTFLKHSICIQLVKSP